jgi:hypothetical protein
MGVAMNQIEPDKNSMIMLQKLHRWRMAFFGLVILLAGIVIGAASTLIVCRHTFMGPPPPPELAPMRMIRDLQRHLDLSPEQQEKIKPILKRHMQKLREIRMNARPQITNQLKLLNEEISSLLDEHQKRLWQHRFHRLQGRLTRGPHRHRNGPRRHRFDPNRRFRRGPEHYDWSAPPEARDDTPEPNGPQGAPEL